jgi:hypothetical protein
VEKFMRDLIIGCASVRFHRPNSGIGLNAMAKATIKAVRKLETLIKLWEVEPRRDLLSEYEGNAAYLAAKPGEKYFIYFTYGDSVGLDLTGHPGVFSVKWIDMNTGEWGDDATIKGGEIVTLTAPDVGGWIAAIIR